MPPALPGFYYDAEKDKYFKIQPNHVAAHGSASKYSKAAVKEEAEEQREQKRRKLFEQKERTTRIKRSRVLESPLVGGWGLTRELGVAKLERATIMMRAWAQGLQRKEVSNFLHQDGGSGTFVFDTDMEVLTHAEVLRGTGGSALLSMFVGSSLRCSGRDADDGYFRGHSVPPAHDSGRGSWVPLGPVSGGHVFDSQVRVYEMRW